MDFPIAAEFIQDYDNYGVSFVSIFPNFFDLTQIHTKPIQKHFVNS